MAAPNQPTISPKAMADLADGGGRHYRGRGLGQTTGILCPNCDQPMPGPFEDGCPSCGVGRAARTEPLAQEPRMPTPPLRQPRVGAPTPVGLSPLLAVAPPTGLTEDRLRLVLREELTRALVQPDDWTDRDLYVLYNATTLLLRVVAQAPDADPQLTIEAITDLLDRLAARAGIPNQSGSSTDLPPQNAVDTADTDLGESTSS